MKYLFFYYILLNLLIAAYIRLDCSSYLAEIAISHFNECNSRNLDKVMYVLIIAFITFLIISFVIKMPQTSNFHLGLLPNQRKSGYLVVAILSWCGIAVIYRIIVFTGFSISGFRSITYTLAGCLLPLLMYTKISTRAALGKHNSRLFLPAVLITSLLFLTKTFLLYYITASIMRVSRQKNNTKRLMKLLLLISLVIILYNMINISRGYFSNSADVDFTSISMFLMKIVVRILIVDQILWSFNLVDEYVVRSVVDLTLASNSKLMAFGYVEGTFGFSHSIFGPLPAVYGYVMVPIIVILLYTFLMTFCSMLRINQGSIYIFPVGLQIVNNGMNLQSTLLMASMVATAVLYKLKVVKL